MNKRLISGLAALTFVFAGAGALPTGAFEGLSLAASAETIVDSGFCGVESDNEGKNVTWTLDSDGTLTISGTGQMRNYTMDESNAAPWQTKTVNKIVILDGVTSIGATAFYYLRDVTEVSIPNSVTSIGDSAFFFCQNITSVVIPGSVTSIGNQAFCWCFALTDITIPESVTYIGGSAFSDTPWITAKIQQDPLVVVNNIIIDGKNVRGSVVIPEGVKSIGNWAFNYNENLTSISIPNSVKVIDDSAFRYCNSFTNITVPNSVTYMGEMAFSLCSNLVSIELPNSIRKIETNTFSQCKSLTSIVIPEGITTIGEFAFSICENLTSVTIPSSVTYIDLRAFHWDTKLMNVTIPDTVTYIHPEAFGYYYNQEHEQTEKLEGFTVTGRKGSEAELFAKKNRFTFIALPTEEHDLGNVNGDGNINLADLGLLQQYLAGWTVTIDEEAADVTGDGEVNSEDLALLQKYFAGWHVKFKRAVK